MKIYLATPYSHPDPMVRNWRFEMACIAAGLLIKEGHIVFSPIAHSHPISLWIENSNDNEFWLDHDIPFMDWADVMIVGEFRDDPVVLSWYDSYGINFETDYMLDHGKPVHYSLIKPGYSIEFGGGFEL